MNASRPVVAPDIPRPALLGASRALLLAGICSVLAAFSLVPLSQVTGPDPNAWMAWSYSLLHGNGVDLGHGPAWKPLPVLVMAPLNLAGTDATALLWLFLVRFGAFWCSAMLFTLVRRDGGVAGASIAAVLPLTIRPWLNTTVVGESEAIALALVLTAFVLFLDSRPRAVTGLLTLAGLLRPEVWPLMVLQLIVRGRSGQRPALLDGIAAAAVLAVGWVLWPQLIAAGGTPFSMQGGLTMKDATFSDVGSNILGVMPPKAWVLIPFGIAGAVLARRAGPLLLTAGAMLLIIEIVVLWALRPPISDAGYTPVLRYFAVAGVMLCGVAGAGADAIIERAPKGLARRLAVLLATGVVCWSFATAADGARSAIDRSLESGRSSREAAEAIRRAGGMEAIAPCRPITISNWSAISWSISRRLGIPLAWFSSRPRSPSVALDFTEGGWVLRTVPPDDAAGRELLATSGPWEVVHYPGSGPGCLRRGR